MNLNPLKWKFTQWLSIITAILFIGIRWNTWLVVVNSESGISAAFSGFYNNAIQFSICIWDLLRYHLRILINKVSNTFRHHPTGGYALLHVQSGYSTLILLVTFSY